MTLVAPLPEKLHYQCQIEASVLLAIECYGSYITIVSCSGVGGGWRNRSTWLVIPEVSDSKGLLQQ